MEYSSYNKEFLFDLTLFAIKVDQTLSGSICQKRTSNFHVFKTFCIII